MTETVYYISPSSMPSRAANTMHVVFMCEALASLGYQVKLFVHSEKYNSRECEKQLKEYYGIDNNRIEIVALRVPMVRGIEMIMGVMAFFSVIKDAIFLSIPKHVISRNLFGALFLGNILRRKLIYETHAPEHGLRKIIQKIVMGSKNVSTIVISQALCRVLSLDQLLPETTFNVMHDAARAGNEPMTHVDKEQRRRELLSEKVNLSKFDKIAGYFGHLYSGRGIDIIIDVARINKNIAFIIYGGNDSDIKKYQEENELDNIFFMGFISPDNVRTAMAMMDVLLMPYQRSVSVGLDCVDTAKWMSPMKLFEYMSVGVPFIASDLPVLKEVLRDRYNCLLAEPDDAVVWSDALKNIVNDDALAKTIAENAHREYKKCYTWSKRSERMLGLTRNQV